MAKRRSLVSTSQPATVEQTEIVRANVHRVTEKSPSYVSLYTNDIQVQLSPWDVRLIVGQIDSIGLTVEDPTVVVQQVGELRLSLPLAKKLTLILVNQLKGYEQRIGTIHIPED